ncbi:MAG: hypothetical protein AAF989_13410, partial [Planctomycetota bacterium]
MTTFKTVAPLASKTEDVARWTDLGQQLADSLIRREAFSECQELLDFVDSQPSIADESDAWAELREQLGQTRRIAGRVYRQRELFADAPETRILECRYRCLVLRDWSKGVRLANGSMQGRFARFANLERETAPTDI